MSEIKYRVESDLLGELQVPADAYYGVQTQRALNNYKISNTRMCDYPEYVVSIAYVKMAAAAANAELGVVDKNIADAIIKACEEIVAGKFHDQFPVDMMQGGAGTSVNMNANEVIANRALEIMGHKKGEYQFCSPNDHVNCAQSTNDAYPTAFRYTFVRMNKILVKSLTDLIDAFRAKGEEFKDIIKMGRTQLQDAVPMTSGQEFIAFADNLEEEIANLEERLATHNATIHALYEERKERSEALQQWLFRQFNFLNAHGERQNLTSLFQGRFIPSGAGECCAPKLLQTAYLLGLQPLAMAEFWWGSSSPTHYRAPGAFFPACRSKCHPILGHMLQGLNVEPDPAQHYENRELPPVSIIWEDEHLAVIAKPEGWVSIPGRSDQPCIIDECYRLWPHIKGSVVVHRLDQDTSGLMVIAKNARMHHILSQQFERREVHKRYVALLDTPQLDRPPRFTLSLPLAPDLDNMPRRRVDFQCGKEAITDCEIVGKERHGIRDVTRIIFYPHTGRTHQLRVHASSPCGLNAPILGDRLYGLPDERLFLHAEMLEFEHPVTHEQLHFELPAPF